MLPAVCLFMLVATARFQAAAAEPTAKSGVKGPEFPPELVEFGPASEKPLLAGTQENSWDYLVRERGWIRREGDTWHLWYTGYNPGLSDSKFLGYATSVDGIEWLRCPSNPLTKDGWVEDMCVVKHDGTYYMFAEGRGDIAHLLTSKDRVHWKEQGELDIRMTDGKPISAGPRGTPTVWLENGTWWLFYERADRGVWLATSDDLKVWTNKNDEPVIKMGPDDYDRYAVAVDQIIRYQGRYYAYYHASALEKWGEWTTCLAVSDDLVHWKKYPGNPVLPVDPAGKGRSSGMLVHDGKQFRLYTTHPDVRVRFPKARSE
jgi:sucrose-6-phosphate hydrolase SacC (GH32 family)